MISTRLTELLVIEAPVMLAGMGGVGYHEMAAAAAYAGGVGCLGASTMPDEVMVEEIARTAAATDKPFGVDLLTAAGDMTDKVRAIIAGGASVFVAGLGVPRDVVEQCHDAGLLVVNMCGKVRHAVDAVAAGCDLVVAQGTEAGGHTGRVATMALVPQVVDAVGDQVPVVAAGGVVGGGGRRAARALGAVGVWVGSRFIATPQARAVSGYKDTLLNTGEDGTTVTRAYTGKTCRVVRNRYTEGFEEQGGVAEPFPGQFLKSLEDGANHLGGGPETEGVDPEREFFPCGQGVGSLTALVPAADLVTGMVADAEEILGRASRLLA